MDTYDSKCHWSDAYLGWEYIPNERDCAVLVIEAMKEVFGRQIHLPRDYQVHSVFGAAKMFSECFEDIGERVENPCDGDMVLMNVGGKPSHIGIYCNLETPHILHALKGFGCAVRTPVSQLIRLGMTIEGYYKCK